MMAGLMSAESVVQQDLEKIVAGLNSEFGLMSGRRLLVTGGAGFLGHYLVQAALFWNHSHGTLPPISVVVLDSYVRGVPDWLNRLSKNPALELVQHDIARPISSNLGAFDFIIHAASIASPTYYRKCPIETMDANVNGLRHLLDNSLDQLRSGHPISGFLFFSSSEIYGDPSPEFIPTPETYRGYVSCTGPRACYDESKRYGETLCVNFAAVHDLPVRIVRPFNNYGPGLKISDRRVIPDMARDVLGGRDIVLLSDGSPRRTFCYVADAVIGYFKVLVRGRAGEAYNIGTEKPEISMAELAELVAGIGREWVGYSGKVIRGQTPDRDYLVDNPNRRCPNIEKARCELGFEPSVLLDEGLRRTFSWYMENREASDK